MDIPRITHVSVPARFQLSLRFSDGYEGLVDLANVAGRGVFARWLEPGDFERVQVDPDWGCVIWKARNSAEGDVDLCPGALRSQAEAHAARGGAPDQRHAA
ncbi:MAG: DUF2442 domain-containing protein [Phycisphaerales bacterium]|nr:DUF2442 domain-containing protein [Phycisphaerales bacterium]